MRKSYFPLCLLSVTSLLLAGSAWESKPFTQWSEKEALSLLTRSSWSGEQTIRRLRSAASGTTSGPALSQSGETCVQPSGDAGIATGWDRATAVNTVTHSFTIQFVSARPVRMAWARLAMLQGRLKPDEASDFVDRGLSQEQIVISVSVPAGQPAPELQFADSDVLVDATFLELKTSRRRIFLTRFTPLNQAGRTEGLFFFPRQADGQDLVHENEDEILFECRLHENLTLSQKFKLKKMIFNGRLEL